MYLQLKKTFTRLRGRDEVGGRDEPQAQPAAELSPEEQLSRLQGDQFDEQQRQVVHVTTDRLCYLAGEVVYITVTLLHHFSFAQLPRKPAASTSSDLLGSSSGSPGTSCRSGSASESVINLATFEIFQVPLSSETETTEDGRYNVPVWKTALRPKEQSSTIAMQWQSTNMLDVASKISAGGQVDGSRVRETCRIYRLLVSFPHNSGFPSADCTFSVAPPVSLFRLLGVPAVKRPNSRILAAAPLRDLQMSMYASVVRCVDTHLARLQGGQLDLSVAVCDGERLAVSGVPVAFSALPVLADGSLGTAAVSGTATTKLDGFCSILAEVPPLTLREAEALRVTFQVEYGPCSCKCACLLPVVDDRTVSMQFVPESTRSLLEGVPNKVYVKSSIDATKSAVSLLAEVRVGLPGAMQVACVLKTDANGHGSMWICPAAEESIAVRILALGDVILPEEDRTTLACPLRVVSHGLLLNCGYPRVGRDGTLRATILSTMFRDPVPLHAVIYKREKKVGSRKIEINSSLESFVLSIPALVDGVLRLCIYGTFGGTRTVLAERLIFKQPCRRLHVTVNPKEDLRFVTRPEVDFSAVVRDHAGKPVPNATLTVTVLAQYSEAHSAAHPLGLVEGAYLQPELQQEIFGGIVSLDAAVDVDRLLSLQLWRKFKLNDINSFAAQYPLEAERALAFHQADPMPAGAGLSVQPAMVLYAAVALDACLLIGAFTVLQCNDLAGLNVAALTPKLLAKLGSERKSAEGECVSYELERANLHVKLLGRLAFVCVTERQVRRATAVAMLEAMQEKFTTTFWDDIEHHEAQQRVVSGPGQPPEPWQMTYEEFTSFRQFLLDVAQRFSNDPSREKVLQMRKELKQLQLYLQTLAEASRVHSEQTEKMGTQQVEMSFLAQKYLEYKQSFAGRLTEALFSRTEESEPMDGADIPTTQGTEGEEEERVPASLSSAYLVLPPIPRMEATVLNEKELQVEHLLFNVRKHVNYATDGHGLPPRVLFYETGMKTDSDGVAHFSLESEGNVMSYVVNVDAHAVVTASKRASQPDQYLGAVGSERRTFDSRAVFQVDVGVPNSTQLINGNRVSIPVQLMNGTPMPRTMTLTFAVEVDDGTDVTTLPLSITGIAPAPEGETLVVPPYSYATRLLQATVRGTTPSLRTCRLLVTARNSSSATVQKRLVHLMPAGFCRGAFCSFFVAKGDSDLADLEQCLPLAGVARWSSDLKVVVSLSSEPSSFFARCYSLIQVCPTAVFGFCWSRLVLAGLVLHHATAGKLENLKASGATETYRHLLRYQRKLCKFVDPETSQLSLYLGSSQVNLVNVAVRAAHAIEAMLTVLPMIDCTNMVYEMYTSLLQEAELMISNEADPVGIAYCLFTACRVYRCTRVANLMQQMVAKYDGLADPYYLALSSMLQAVLCHDAPGGPQEAVLLARQLAKMQAADGSIEGSQSVVIARDMLPVQQGDVVLENVAAAVRCWCRLGIEEFGTAARNGVAFMLSGVLAASGNPMVVAWCCTAIHAYWAAVKELPAARSAERFQVEVMADGQRVTMAGHVPSPGSPDKLTLNVPVAQLQALAADGAKDLTVRVRLQNPLSFVFGGIHSTWFSWDDHSRPADPADLSYTFSTSITPMCTAVGGTVTVTVKQHRNKAEGHPCAVSLFLPPNVVLLDQGAGLLDSIQRQTSASYVRHESSKGRVLVLFGHSALPTQEFSVTCRALLPGMCQARPSFVCHLASFLAPSSGTCSTKDCTFAPPLLCSVLPEEVQPKSAPSTPPHEDDSLL